MHHLLQRLPQGDAADSWAAKHDCSMVSAACLPFMRSAAKLRGCISLRLTACNTKGYWVKVFHLLLVQVAASCYSTVWGYSDPEHGRCMLKVVRPYDTVEAIEAYDREVTAYEALKDLQGKVVPMLHRNKRIRTVRPPKFYLVFFLFFLVLLINK
jgi:hypothetical protein